MKNLLKSTFLIGVGAACGLLFAHQTPEKKPVIQSKLTNVVLTTTDIAAEAAFFENNLGFKSFYKDKTSCFLKTGGANLVFVVVPNKTKATKNFCLDVGVVDLDAASDALSKAGVKVDKSDPHILKFSDPDGNLIEVVRG